MALSSSPRKLTIPLATGDESRPRQLPLVPSVTKRVFYCGVVIEGSENGRRLPEEIQDLVLSFGEPLSAEQGDLAGSTSATPNATEFAQRGRTQTDTASVASIVNELLTTERNYVRRLQILKGDYADPLRSFARNRDTYLIQPYEARTIFGNIDNLLPVNEAFLSDLEEALVGPDGLLSIDGVGDIALKHFKELKGFEQYRQYYVKREEAQAIFERELAKKSSRFGSYIERIKYQCTDPKHRVGLRELLMEPVQRIPRYTLLFRQIMKYMAHDDPQRVKIAEADAIASTIAKAEIDEHTRRATIFSCLNATIEGFPADLVSNSRKFIDCIDVEDILSDVPGSSAASSTAVPSTILHCTLFLFDDKLLIVKRPNSQQTGQRLSYLDNVEKYAKIAGPIPKKKSGLAFRGVVELTDVVATDAGGAEINFYLENPPQDLSDRWSNRAFRSLCVVNPPHEINFDPTETEVDKRRFLENLWNAQAMYRARAGQSVILCANEQEVDCRGGRIILARTYYNVYQRTAFLQEPKKTKVVVHVDPLGSADPIPFGLSGPPLVVIRIQPMAGALCRYSVTSSDPADQGEEDIVQTDRVPARIVQTIHQFGLFEFKTGRNSLPSTPTHRSKVAIFGLDAISRNLFNSRPASAMGDFFAGSINGHKRHRSRSTASRSSMYTQTTTTHTTTTNDSMKFTIRSGSSVTNATTVSGMDDDNFFASRSSKGKNLSKRSRSRTGETSDSDVGSPSRDSSRSRTHSRTSSWAVEPEYSDLEDDANTILASAKELGPSDYNLALQLELARQNSLSQTGQQLPPLQLDMPSEATIYEEEPPPPVRPTSRTSRPTSPTKRMSSPTRDSHHERRPIGPRSPSPLPPKSPQIRPTDFKFASTNDDDEADAQSTSRLPTSTAPSGIPRSKRQHFPQASVDSTPKASFPNSAVTATPIEPLSIKKKTSVRTSTIQGSPTPARKPHSHTRNSPLNRGLQRVVSPRRVSPSFKKAKATASSKGPLTTEDFENMRQLAESMTYDIESSRRVVQRIKREADNLVVPSSKVVDSPESRPTSPEKVLRIPQANQPMTKAAQERLEEMRALINKGRGEVTPKSTKLRTNLFETPLRVEPLSLDTAGNGDNSSKIIINLANEAEANLSRAQSNTDALHSELNRLAAEFKERTAEIERSRHELQSTRRQLELVKNLLADATAEKEIMYDAFNEELDGMFNDINLPDDEAWHVLTADLRKTKETRNALSRENSLLKERLAEAELQKDEWGEMLRTQGLIS